MKVELTDVEIRSIEIHGLADTDVHTAPLDLIAAVESIVAARVTEALRDAAKQVAGLVPYGYGMNPDGTEDRTAMAYVEGHHEAWQLLTNLADEYIPSTDTTDEGPAD